MITTHTFLEVNFLRKLHSHTFSTIPLLLTTSKIKGLLQLRNELVYFISRNKLPLELKNEERFCSKCSHLTVCSLLNETKEVDSNNNIELYTESIKHLSESEKSYFLNWYKMLELEFEDQKQFDAGDLIWYKSQEELEASGWSVFNLKLSIKSESVKKDVRDEIEYDGEGFFSFEFIRE